MNVIVLYNSNCETCTILPRMFQWIFTSSLINLIVCSNNGSPLFLVCGVQIPDFCVPNLETQQGQRSSHSSSEFILETSAVKILMLQSSVR
jgi:hypothetical protein